jgi:hypothetical protein
MGSRVSGYSMPKRDRLRVQPYRLFLLWCFCWLLSYSTVGREESQSSPKGPSAIEVHNTGDQFLRMLSGRVNLVSSKPRALFVNEVVAS